MPVRLSLRLRLTAWATLAALILFGAVALGIGVYHGEQRDASQSVAVFTADGVVLRVGNGVSYPPVTLNGITVKLNRGVEARVRGHRANAWVQVELTNGLIGWVPRAGLLMDREPPS